MCKIGLFLLPHIPEAGDLSGFLFPASRDSQSVLCFLWVAVREVLHMKKHTAGFNRLICSFCLFQCYLYLGLIVCVCMCVCVYVRARACVYQEVASLRSVMNRLSRTDKFGRLGTLVLHKLPGSFSV